MAIDPNIILQGTRPLPQVDPLAGFAAAAQIAQVREQTEARRLAAEEARTKAARQRQIDEAYSKAVRVNAETGDIDIDYGMLVQNVDPAAIPDVMKELQADKENAVKLQKAHLELATLKNTALGGMAQTVVAAKGEPVIWATELRAARDMGLLTPEDFARLDRERDPATILAMAQNYVTRAGLGTKPQPPELVTHVPTSGPFAGQEVQEFVVPTLGVQYAKPAKEEEDVSYQRDEVLLDGKRAFVWANPKTRRYYNNAGEDVTAHVVPIPPQAQGGGGQRPITQTAEANLITQLNKQWTTAAKPKRELDSQLATMRVGLQAAEKGNLPQGTEAVLQPFLKILDPTSVVREGEFWRLREGMSFLARAQTAMQRLTSGGFVPLDELKKYAALAEQIATRYDSYVRGERTRIGRVADRYSIPHELIFEGGPILPDTEALPPPSANPETVPANVATALQTVGTGRYTLEDGSVWDKRADGSIVKVR